MSNQTPRTQEPIQLPPGYIIVPSSQAYTSQPAKQQGRLRVSDQLAALVFLVALAALFITNQLPAFWQQVTLPNAPAYVSPSYYGKDNPNCHPPLICPDNSQSAPSQAAPVQAPPVQVAPVQVAPVQAPPVQAAPVQAPVQAAPVAPEPTVQIDSVRQAPAQVEEPVVPAQVEQPAAPAQVEQPVVPAQVEQPVAPAQVEQAPVAPASQPSTNMTAYGDDCHPPMVCEPTNSQHLRPVTAPAEPAPAEPQPAPPQPVSVPEKPSVLLPSQISGYTSPSDFGTINQEQACHPPMVCNGE